jgi:hypothetical protein
MIIIIVTAVEISNLTKTLVFTNLSEESYAQLTEHTTGFVEEAKLIEQRHF